MKTRDYPIFTLRHKLKKRYSLQ